MVRKIRVKPVLRLREEGFPSDAQDSGLDFSGKVAIAGIVRVSGVVDHSARHRDEHTDRSA